MVVLGIILQRKNTQAVSATQTGEPLKLSCKWAQIKWDFRIILYLNCMAVLIPRFFSFFLQCTADSALDLL